MLTALIESNELRMRQISQPLSQQVPGLTVDIGKLMLHAVVQDLYEDDEEARIKLERRFQELLAATLTQAEESRRQMELTIAGPGQPGSGGLIVPGP